MKRLWRGFVIVVSFVLVACSNGSDSQTQDVAAPGGNYNQENTAVETDDNKESGQALIGEKVIKTVNLSYETLEYENTTNHVMETVNDHDAYLEYSYESSYTPSGSFGPDAKEYRQIEYKFRVPTESLNAFLKDIEGMEAVKTSEQIGSEDVTQTYLDTEARINVLNQKEERLSQLMEQAETIDQILLIEDSLSETIAEREALLAQLETIDDLVAYTEVHMTVSERQRISEKRGEGISFWDRIQEAFLNSTYAFYYWIQDAIIFLIFVLPYLLIIGVILIIVFFMKRKFVKTDSKQRPQKEKRQPKERKKMIIPPSEKKTHEDDPES